MAHKYAHLLAFSTELLTEKFNLELVSSKHHIYDRYMNKYAMQVSPHDTKASQKQNTGNPRKCAQGGITGLGGQNEKKT